MFHIDFQSPFKIHFIGIGGISMSGLAEILLKEGFQVSGSDSRPSALTERLESLGCTIFYGQRPENIQPDTKLVVYTAAIHPDNPEYQQAQSLGLPLLSRAELLGQLMANYRTSIAVAGTHGKTTTTSMLSEVLLLAGTDPTISVGGILQSIHGNIRVGGAGVFVTEACEYTNSFLSFFPTMEIVLNIEEDHLDFFKDLEDIRHSFRLFAEKLPESGVLIINGEIERLEEITGGLPCRVLTFGGADGDFQAENVRHDELARAEFDLIRRGEKLGHLVLGVAGEHNVSNALAAAAACLELGVPFEEIAAGLKKFTGTNRRFERKGEIGGVTVIDDYAHHPSEIRATLSAARNYPHRKIWCVFQPHTYTRTKAFMDDFAQALSGADEVILADIYAARETDTLGISSRDLAEKICALGTKATYLPSFDEIETFILENCVHGDLLITMGAGDIVKVGEKLLGM